MPTQVPHPFQGAMGTQIVCNGCGFKVGLKKKYLVLYSTIIQFQ